MMNSSNESNNWLSIADMMTALMVIFMFIAINYILQVIEHTFIEDEIFNKLTELFQEEIKNGDITISPDGSVRFNYDRNKKLFKLQDDEPTPEFKSILDEFIPKYWKIINSDSSYLDYIKEIRIEGHADSNPFFKRTDTLKSLEVSYLNNLDLSQRRAAKVLQYLRSNNIFFEAKLKERKRMNFLFTSIGFSNARTLNKNGNITYLDTLKKVDNDLSRRVEFRIVTSNEKLIERIYEK